MKESWQTLRAELADALLHVADPAQARTEVREELERLRTLVVGHREPRVALLGKLNVSLGETMQALGLQTGWEDIRQHLGHGRWYDHESDRGVLAVADLRSEDRPCLKALDYQEPDVIVAFARSADVDVAATVAGLVDAMERTEDAWGRYPTGLVAVCRGADAGNAADFRTMQAFRDAFEAAGVGRDWVDIVSTARAPGLGRAVLNALPPQARLSFARLTTDPDTKREQAFELVRLAASLNAGIASIPIPIASIVPITTVQLAMIAGVAYLSGRQAGPRSIAEFIAAIGLNVGAGVAFRELARALVAWIPVAGPVVSASIAAGATLTLGRAATRHYIT